MVYRKKPVAWNGLKYINLPAPIPEEEKKLTYIFIFTRLRGASKGFMKVLKAFIKLSEAPQRSVKIEV